MLAPALSVPESPAPAVSLPALRLDAVSLSSTIAVDPALRALPSQGFRLRSYTDAPYFARPPRPLRGGYLP